MNEGRPLSHTTYSNDFNMDRRPKVRPETIKLLEIIGVHLHDLGLDPTAKTTKENINWVSLK